MKTVAILGSTGSIGVSTLEIVSGYPERYRVAALSGGKNITLLAELSRRYRPEVVAVIEEQDAAQLRGILGSDGPQVMHGPEGLIACAVHADVDIVVSAIVGAAGLVPTMAAIEAGKDVALANKETLVTAGPLVMRAVADRGVKLFPVDSEHSAIFQSLQGHRFQDVRRLILTASGGPFLHRSQAELQHVRPADALAHPNWAMGQKISIDSATMMNKGLEVIEARWLFGLDGERIDVHIHPQSIVHSMVEYIDGSVIAQMGVPDMKAPISYALSYPERLPLPMPPLDLCHLGQLTFLEPDHQKFSCLALAYEALAAGGSAPAVLNAANEVAVAAFLSDQIRFVDIAGVIDETLQGHSVYSLEHVDDALRADLWGRRQAAGVIKSLN